METILIVDDEKNYPLILSAVLEEEGYEALTANSGTEALSIISHSDIDLVLTDMKMPEMDGILLLENIKTTSEDLPVIMMTAHGTVDKAVEAMQKGAFNYILKPFENSNLIAHINKAIALRRVVKENKRLQEAVQSMYRFGKILGKSRAISAVFSMIQKAAPTSATVLIEGESGTGKELVAKSIHYNSVRSYKPFIAINCTALNENLLESELFGHEKGSFTGAASMKKGRIELADGGTLFLDEIGELSQHLQAKLLRVLQERMIERVGGISSIKVDFRLIAATNKSLKDEVKKRNFREDLFYRLSVLTITIPPLRERQEDIHLLANHFIRKYENERKSEKPVTGIDPECERLFYDYNWPGNVRELENLIERAMILSPGGLISVNDLPRNFKKNVYRELHLDGIPADANLSETLAGVEKMMIIRALKFSNYIQSHAAQQLGIGKSGLNQKIKKYNIDVRSKS